MDIYDGADGRRWISTISRPPLKTEARSRKRRISCRADLVDDVARKCEELGLKPKAKS
jgi:hypothetical protein